MIFKIIDRIIDFFEKKKAQKEEARKAYERAIKLEIEKEKLREKREHARYEKNRRKEEKIERERWKREQERIEEKRKKEERKNWAKAQRFKDNPRLIQDIEKNKSKIIAEQEFHKPIIKKRKNGAVLFFKGKKFLFCEEGFDKFEEYFQNEEYYKLVIKDNYLSREHIEEGYIQYFHRWLMKYEVENFAEEQRVETRDIEVHHLDLTTTNNHIKNLKPLLKREHKKLHIRLKFEGSDEAYENWYEEKINMRVKQSAL